MGFSKPEWQDQYEASANKIAPIPPRNQRREMIAPGEAGRQDSASGSWVRLRRKPKSFVKLILLGFALVGLPLIVALINSAFSIDRLANQSRKVVYQAAEIAHSSRALADEIANMERAVRQTHILGDTALLEGYFRGHAGFEKIAAGLAELSLSDEQRRLLVQLKSEEAVIFERVSAVKESPEELRKLIGNFGHLRDSARFFFSLGYALIEREVDEMQD